MHELTLWPEQAVWSFFPSRLVCAIECWPLEAGFLFPNKNFVVISCFTLCIEILTMLGVVIVFIYQHVAG